MSIICLPSVISNILLGSSLIARVFPYDSILISFSFLISISKSQSSLPLFFSKTRKKPSFDRMQIRLSLNFSKLILSFGLNLHLVKPFCESIDNNSLSVNQTYKKPSSKKNLYIVPERKVGVQARQRTNQFSFIKLLPFRSSSSVLIRF